MQGVSREPGAAYIRGKHPTPTLPPRSDPHVFRRNRGPESVSLMLPEDISKKLAAGHSRFGYGLRRRSGSLPEKIRLGAFGSSTSG